MRGMACSPSWDKGFYVLPEERCLETVSTFQAPNNPNHFKSKALKNQTKALHGCEVLAHAIPGRNLLVAQRFSVLYFRPYTEES